MKVICSVLFLSGLLPASAELIGYYPFDADFSDQSGKDNHAIVSGDAGAITIDSTAVVGSGSVAFDNGATGGGLNVLSVNHGTGGLNLSGMPAFTLSIWFNTTADQTDRRIFSEASNTSTNPLYTLGTGTIRTTPPENLSTNEQFNFYRRTAANAVTNNHQVSPESPFETGTWQNAVWIDKGGTVDLYLNGTYSRSYTYTVSDLQVNTTSFGGVLRAAGLAGFTGNLDDIAIWNEVPINPAAFAEAIAAGAAANTVPIDIGADATDTDNDGMNDAWEIANGLIVGIDDSAEDPDEDGLTNLEEFTHDTDPHNPDTDNDGLNDGAEIALGAHPRNPDTDGDLYLDGVEVARSTDPNDNTSIGYPTTSFTVDFSSNGTTGQSPTFHDQDSFPFVASHEVDSATNPTLGVDRSETWPVASLGGADITLTVGYPDTTDVAVKQMIGRTDGQAAMYEGTRLTLMRDWLGIDARPASGGNGTEAPTTMTLTLSGLPAGTYLYRGYHHDVELMRSSFDIAVTDSSRESASLGSFRMTHSSSNTLHQTADPGPGNGPEALTSTIEFVVVANGTDDVVVSYQITEGAVLHRSFFGINGFGLAATVDSDDDFVPDFADLNPGLGDGALDDDNDNLSNLREFHLGTDPTNADTDNDGWNDDVETDTDIFVSLQDTGTSPFVADWDNDGLVDGLETNDGDFSAWPAAAGTDPFNPDTDGDGHTDGEEALAGFNPTDSLSFPPPLTARILAVDLAGGSVAFEWNSIAGATYDIYARDTLEGDPLTEWSRIEIAWPSDGGDVTDYTETLPSPAPAKRFYVIYEYP